jgi:hypothetical protein
MDEHGSKMNGKGPSHCSKMTDHCNKMTVKITK